MLDILGSDTEKRLVTCVGIRMMHSGLVVRRRGHPAGPLGDGTRSIAGPLCAQRGQVGTQTGSLNRIHLRLSLAGGEGQ